METIISTCIGSVVSMGIAWSVFKQWQKDNFLKTAKEIVRAEHNLLESIQKIYKNSGSDSDTDNEIRAVFSKFLNELDIYALYFLNHMVDKKMVNEYFKDTFLGYWNDVTIRQYIQESRKIKTTVFEHLEKFCIKLSKER